MCDKSNELIKKLVLNFFKCLHIDLKPEDIKLMTWANQEAFLNQTINSSLFKKYPINLNFCRLFFKRLIQTLDQEDQEVHDDMYTFICSTMKNCDENGFNYHHYVINNNLSNVITIKETRNMVINGTTGLKTWEAALMLSDWSMCNKQLFSNKKILELGSGVGFTGITIAKHCQIKSIIMSDCHAEVLKTINDNIQINFPNAIAEERSYATMYKSDTKMIGTLMLDWNEINDLSTCLIPDIIIGADIVYDPSILQALLNVFELFYKRNDNINIYIASVIRNKDTFNKFVKILDSSNFKHKQLCLMKNSFIDWNVNIDKCLLKITKDYIFNVLISYL